MLCDGVVLTLLNRRRGPSGGGKTTLLNVLSGRVLNLKGAKLTGSLIVNDKPRDENAFKSHAAFVQQDDLLFSFLVSLVTVGYHTQPIPVWRRAIPV